MALQGAGGECKSGATAMWMGLGGAAWAERGRSCRRSPLPMMSWTLCQVGWYRGMWSFRPFAGKQRN